MSPDKSGIAVMASLTDFGLTAKEARGVYPEETALVKPLASAKASIQRFAQRLGVSLEGSPRAMAANFAEAQRQSATRTIPAPSIVPGTPEPGM